jgi:probable phosphoglycerate mutase
MSHVGSIVMIRHGRTEWSATGRHTSVTDIDLTAEGAERARALSTLLREYDFAVALSSPRLRARRTAELADLTVTVDDDLAEWDYGEYEGITTPQIRSGRPEWSLWTDGSPSGETPDQVGTRVDRLLDRVRPELAHGDVALVGHGHLLRVVGVRWVGWPVSAGAALALDPGGLSELGFEHENPVIRHWNQTA